MSLEKLIERIKNDATKKAKFIKKEAQKEAEAIIQQATDSSLAEKKKRFDEAKKKVQLQQEAALAKARLDARDLVLKSKRNILNKAFENAFIKVNKISSQDYENLLIQLLINNSKGTEQVLMANSLATKIVDKANQAMAKLGRAAQLKASEEKMKDKGLILIDEQGTRTDLTIKSLIDYHSQEMEQHVFDILSGKTSDE